MTTATKATKTAVTIDRRTLADGLKLASLATSGKTPLPITQHVLLTADETGLRLQTTNLEHSLTIQLAASVESEGQLTMPVKILKDLLGTLAGDTVTITAAEQHRAEIRCGRTRSTLTGFDPEDFPPIPTAEPADSFTMDAELLQLAVGKVLVAAAKDETRPVLAGVCFRVEPGRLTLVAADGFRMAVWSGAVETEASYELIAPAAALRSLLAMRDADDITVGRTSKGQLFAKAGHVELVVQPIDGVFPNFELLIPKEPGTQIDVAVADLLKAVKGCALLAADDNPAVRLAWDAPGVGGTSTLRVWASSEMGEGRTELAAVVGGDAGKVGLNRRYLLEHLPLIPGGVRLSVTGKAAAVVLRSTEDDGLTQVIMPMHLPWEE